MSPKIPYKRRWFTQPAVLDGGELLCDTHVKDVGSINVVEVRVDDKVNVYVTIGDLFNQQTIKVPDHRAALTVIDIAGRHKSDKPRELPVGWELCAEAQGEERAA